ISELDDKYVGRVEDVCKVGDVLQVKVIAIDDQDRVKLSRKVLLREAKGLPPETGGGPPPRRDRGDRGEGGPRRERGDGGARRRENGPEGRERREDRGERREERGGERYEERGPSDEG